MSARVRVLCGVTIRRVITAQRRGARLTRPQMDPLCADLHALFAFPPLRMFDSLNRSYVRAAFLRHHRLLYSVSTRCTKVTAIDPSSTAAATRLMIGSLGVSHWRLGAADQALPVVDPYSPAIECDLRCPLV